VEVTATGAVVQRVRDLLTQSYEATAYSSNI
jgi:hypothetical protein